MNVSVMYSPYEPTVGFFPSFTWNVATDFDLDLTTRSFWNEDGRGWTVRSNAMYLRIRWSF